MLAVNPDFSEHVSLFWEHVTNIRGTGVTLPLLMFQLLVCISTSPQNKETNTRK